MIKFYLSTVIIYFIIMLCTSTVFKKMFEDKYNYVYPEKRKNKVNVLKNLFMIIGVCFIPVIRLLFILTILWVSFMDKDKFKEMVKGKEE